MKEYCPNCNDAGEHGRSWLNLVGILQENVPSEINHWLCMNCYHTWYDKQGRFGESLDENTKRILEELKVQFRERVVLAINRFMDEAI